jgi:PAS domain S-box-containing protein
MKTNPQEQAILADSTAGINLTTRKLLSEHGVGLTLSNKPLGGNELSYRQLFEAARDGILILDADTERINDVNVFLMDLLGFSYPEMVGKTIGELSPFKDIESHQVAFERPQKDGYVRYEDLPLETRDGRHIAVEFVGNICQAGGQSVIHCNIRDITARKAAEMGPTVPCCEWCSSICFPMP